MSDTLKTFLFAVVMCLVCSLLLTAASSGLREIQQQNIVLDKQRNILKSVGLVDENARDAYDDIQSRYRENIRPLWVDSRGRILSENERGESDLPVYLYMKDGGIAAYIIPINSKGLWGRIQGYLCLEKDGATVAGFAVYHHSETPGLGGEIEKRWFQKNFSGKRIVDRQGRFVSVGIAKGPVAGTVPVGDRANYVDGISGATLTGRYLTAGIKETLTSYEPISLRFRANPIQEKRQ